MVGGGREGGMEEATRGRGYNEVYLQSRRVVLSKHGPLLPIQSLQLFHYVSTVIVMEVWGRDTTKLFHMCNAATSHV